MDWVLASLTGSIFIAGVSVLDKRILMAHVSGVSGFYGLVGVIQIGIAGVVLLAVPWESGASGMAVAWSIVSGLCWGITLLLMFSALRGLEVSRAVPAYHTFPVFVAIMAVTFLDEHLSVLHWVSILLVVAGAGLVMVGQKQEEGRRNNKVAMTFVFLASAATAVGMVTSKVALEEMNFWNVLALRSIFLGAVLLVPGLMPQGLRQAKVVLADPKAVGLILFAEALIAPVAMYAMLLALSLGSAALVTTLLSTRPVFVLLISASLSTRVWNLMNEPLTRDVLVLKSTSTAMVVGGAAALTLA